MKGNEKTLETLIGDSGTRELLESILVDEKDHAGTSRARAPDAGAGGDIQKESRGRMMDIPIDAEVQCTDGVGGRSTYVVLNPVTRQVTHVVVKENTFPHLERLVPVGMVAETSPDQVHLTCSQQELHRLESFIETEFLPGESPYAAYELDEYRLWPYVLPDDEMAPVEHERVPPGELAVRRGSRVRATDGDVGQVDEFLVDRETEQVTHLVLREGHLWGKRDVLVPVSEIGQIDEDRVYLTLTKEEVASLPTIPVRRWHEGLGEE
jgi:sporulation protein YlmC with PRC-barrel domain